MPWVPKYKAEGLFGPAISPCAMGSLAYTCDHYGNYFEVYDNAGGNYESWSGGSEFVRWLPMGVSFNNKLIGLLKSNVGNGPHTGVVLAEMDFVKPAGAQYYKQTLAIIGTYEAFQEVNHMDTHEGNTYNLKYIPCYIGVTAIYRREYATPYSQPVSTPITDVPTISLSFNIRLSGPMEIENTTYFYDKGYFCLSTYTYNNKTYLGAAFYIENQRKGWDDQTAIRNAAASMCGIGDNTMLRLFGIDTPEEEDDPNEDDDDPDNPGGGSEEGGGENGDHDKRQDPIPYPDDPPIGGASAGFITCYRLARYQIQTFAKKMFSADIMKALKDFFADPLDMICGIMIVPFSPEVTFRARPVIRMISPLPDITWDYYYPVIEDQYQDIDCGSLNMGQFYDSCFDYNPYTRYMIYLPYIGYRDLDPDEITGKDIHVKYKVDCLTGDCVAFLMRTATSLPDGNDVEQVFAQFSGNCGVRVAFGRQSFDSAVQASIDLATGLALGAIRGGGSILSGLAVGLAGSGSEMESDTIAQGQISQGVGAASSAVSMPNVAAMKTCFPKSGVSGGNAGFMSIQKPHIVKIVPRQSRPDNFRQLKGYPSNMPGPISSGYAGYIEIETAELSGIACTEPEKNEIAGMLKGGVFYGHV